jgi:hypothetical protein
MGLGMRALKLRSAELGNGGELLDPPFLEFGLLKKESYTSRLRAEVESRLAGGLGLVYSEHRMSTSSVFD